MWKIGDNYDAEDDSLNKVVKITIIFLVFIIGIIFIVILAIIIYSLSTAKIIDVPNEQLESGTLLSLTEGQKIKIHLGQTEYKLSIKEIEEGLINISLNNKDYQLLFAVNRIKEICKLLSS